MAMYNNIQYYNMLLQVSSVALGILHWPGSRDYFCISGGRSNSSLLDNMAIPTVLLAVNGCGQAFAQLVKEVKGKITVQSSSKGQFSMVKILDCSRSSGYGAYESELSPAYKSSLANPHLLNLLWSNVPHPRE